MYIDKRYYLRPTFKSFMRSFIIDISPVITTYIALLIAGEKMHKYQVILYIITGIFSFYLLIQTIVTHIQKIMILEEGILFSGIARPYGTYWSNIEKAIVRERKNIISGTDKLLVLYLKNGTKIPYNVSTLSKKNEYYVLTEVRRRIPTESIFDKPSV